MAISTIVKKLSAVAAGAAFMALGAVGTAKAVPIGSGQYYTDVVGGGIGAPPTGYVANDDSFFGPYPLGFSLNYFGNTYSNFFLNNNGNISFNNGVSSFTPNPLNTTSTAPMIAPYWADVDTRGTGNGNVTLLTNTPDQVIVTWDRVGYYSQHTDKLASFQLVLRGPNYQVPADEGNIGFFYKDIQWETGDASGGTGGFGGTEATVGFGDGSSTVNPSEFSLPGSQQAGISQLVSNQHLWFNLDNQTGGTGGGTGGGTDGGTGGGTGTIEGSTQQNPVLPDIIPVPGVFVFDDAVSGTWVDPPLASGFEYTIQSPNSQFSQILNFPTGIDADNLYNVLVAGTPLGQFGPGQSVDFTALTGGPVSSFSVTGINPLVDAANPTAFPLQIAFTTLTADFQMVALQADGTPVTTVTTAVPEPSSTLGLLVFGALGAGSVLKRKQKQRL